MRLLLIALLLIACSPAVAAPAPTEDPRIAVLTAERDDLQRQVQTLTDQVAALKAKAAESQTFVMWDSQTALKKGHVLAGGLPDTFTVRIEFVASTPVKTWIMPLSEYLKYMTTTPTGGPTYPAATYVDEVFHEAEGCASYVFVLEAVEDTVISPNFVITRAPSPARTGACAN